jgi:K+-transporting ATPase KdpF subunit
MTPLYCLCLILALLLLVVLAAALLKPEWFA